MTVLSTSEARAEAATIVLHVLLGRLTTAELAELYAAAMLEAMPMRMPDIEDEVAWICRDTPKATTDMLARDECG